MSHKPIHPKLWVSRIVILSKLVQGPLRFEKLWREVSKIVKSKAYFIKAIDKLVAEGAVERNKVSHKFVIYSIPKTAERSHRRELSLARNLHSSTRAELIAEGMEIFIAVDGKESDSWLFSRRREGVEAALGFWVENYQNLCLLGAFFSLSEVDEELSKNVGKLYQATMREYEDILRRLRDKEPDLFKQVLLNQPLIRGIEISPNYVAAKMFRFIENNYPEVYVQLSQRIKDKILLHLINKEKERDQFALRN